MAEKKAASAPKKNTNQNSSTNKGKSISNVQNKSKTQNRDKNSSHKEVKGNQKKGKEPDAVMDEVILVITLLVSLLLILSYIDLCGAVGDFLNKVVFGLIGLLAYVFPFLLFFAVAFRLSNRGNHVANRKLFAGIGLVLIFASLIQMITKYDKTISIFGYFVKCGETKSGGGIIGSILLKILFGSFGSVATTLILLALLIICFMLITGKTFLAHLKETILNRLNEYQELKQNRYEEYEEDEEYEENDYEEKDYKGKNYKENSYKGKDYAKEGVTRTAKIVNLHKSPNDLDVIETIVDHQSEENEQADFIDSLKQIGKKKKNKKHANPMNQEKKQDNYEMEEVLPDKIQEISITGSYRTDENTGNIYEEELKRKFGQMTGENTVFAEKVNKPDSNKNDFIPDSFLDHEFDILNMAYETPMTEKITSKEEAPTNIRSDDNLFDHVKEDLMFESSFIEKTLRDEKLSNYDFIGFDTKDYEYDSGSFENTIDQEDFGLYDSGLNEAFAMEENIGENPEEIIQVPKKEINQRNSMQDSRRKDTPTQTKKASQMTEEDLGDISMAPPEKPYIFPSIDFLSKPPAISKGMTESDLKDTAIKLQSTLESFGVRVSVTNISCGPAVTRYELQPEQGVSVKKITNLTNDIKLNLAASDIRIEAPISGKAAVGIEVPNKEVSSVYFRELIEHNDFKTHSSDVAFAVGKDIGGQVVVTDIAKMPHLLIAGATGSGKSVCINTLIMSILYKSKPSDVRLIMIDPKVVELSIYNGIPHLLIPVVTDPKKASAALNWAVAEMTDRYNKFAELGVRDLKGYNAKVAEIEDLNDPKYQKLPQMVIIVDELADLMMVASNEVETAICRLAQMARAAGMHLIIATQRPSVNVITGVIKANVPSRIAFSVSSAIDSRTIIDGAGAESLLGKGDMLFFPSGIPKPIRVQGAFISDKEVSAVVDFLKEQNEGGGYNTKINEQISNAASAGDSGTTSFGGGGNDRDDYFIEAGKFIIEKDKASIGMLQRIYKIGFNRAARIMDQLAEAGVVGPEEGTKPRKILMSMEEFEEYIEDYM